MFERFSLRPSLSNDNIFTMEIHDLLRVSKPSRYVGGELNSVKKDLAGVRLKFALAFPDVYEVGMSHLGFHILYHILNGRPDIACERVFAPWPDMEKFLLTRNASLTTLESSSPVRDFDVLGFSLLYELNYTGVLNILRLAGIPARAAERGEEFPLVIGGGPCAMNPEPLADFFDAFVLGDGEEVVLELCREIMLSREGREKKEELLDRLSKIEGVYVPSFFHIEYAADGRPAKIISRRDDYRTIRRRVLSSLDDADFPSQPIVPFMEIIHDRLNIEIARGCTRGCRFCQAGMIYRPVRERSPETVLKLVAGGLQATGHDEVSLLSLSTGDYSCIDPLLAEIVDRYGPERVAVSFPSMRIETLKPSLIRRIQEVRKTGFTLAPEAGTERLRRVINKGNSEEDLLATVRAVFSADWRLIKLYFMMGLPTENDEDLAGIVGLCRRALAEARRARGSAQINVSISTFIPKAHTPFQWEPMCSIEEIGRKQQYLRRNLQRQGINVRWADSRLSLLEGVFARGDRRLGKVLEIAYDLGCRLDGWGDHFHYDLWEKAFLQAGVDPGFYVFRRRDAGEVLPWDHLSSRVTREFLLEEHRKALEEVQTPDCRRDACSGCGVCADSEGPANSPCSPRDFTEAEPLPRHTETTSPIVRRFRARFTKQGSIRLLGHLEMSRAMLRAFRRLRVPIAYSQGFHPLPKIAFGPPLPVGYESRAEYMDFLIHGKFPPVEFPGRMNAALPPGIRILETREIALKDPSIFDSIFKAFYLIHFPDSYSPPGDRVEAFLKTEKFPVFWPRKNKSLDLKSIVESLSFTDPHGLKMTMRSSPEGNVRPDEALGFIFGWEEGKGPVISVEKSEVQFRG